MKNHISELIEKHPGVKDITRLIRKALNGEKLGDIDEKSNLVDLSPNDAMKKLKRMIRGIWYESKVGGNYKEFEQNFLDYCKQVKDNNNISWKIY